MSIRNHQQSTGASPRASFFLMARACLLAVLTFAFGTSARGQIIVDWSTTPPKLVSYPQIINSNMDTQVVVKNVNDLLYDYDVNLIATPQIPNDAGSFLPSGGAAAPQAKLIASPCSDAMAKVGSNVTSLNAELAKIFDCTQQKGSDGKLKSVSLSDTIAAWNAAFNSKINPLVALLRGGASQEGSILFLLAQCPNPGDTLSQAQLALAQVDLWQRRINGLHQVAVSVTLSPQTNYQIVVTEKCKGTLTGKQLSQTFSPGSDILNLSLGSILTQIQQRSYANAKDPSNTATNILSVNGTGPYTPLGIALLNYRVPGDWSHTKGDEFGLYLSSGLVLAFGQSNVKASSLGLFAGPSLQFYHRLFVSAGVHVGQFSDFPPGLYPGHTIPTNYGDLTPVNRYTARFAFAITYRTNSFVKGSTTSPSPAKTTSK